MNPIAVGFVIGFLVSAIIALLLIGSRFPPLSF